MALRTAYRQAADGIRVPYRANDRGNHGFVDLRGRPDLAETVTEAAGSGALRSLLVRLAAPGSAIASLGCDLGTHEAARASPDRRHVAGGYLHVVAARYGEHPAQDYHALAKALEAALATRAGTRRWELAFVLQDLELCLDGATGTHCPSLTVCFYASAPNRGAAAHAREALIDALEAALVSPEVAAALAAGPARND